jgi:HTH-type transcriptional regulator, transcriptional repressor of NAD biosynthesis genes
LTHGLVVGKFYPPHAGHHGLIDTALAQSDRLTVAVLASHTESIPHELRRDWLAERHPAAHVVSGYDEHPIDHLSPTVNALHAAVVRELVTEPIGLVFSSEAYGEPFAACLGARHVWLDRTRQPFPISATAVRADPPTHWHRLEPPVRAYLTRRVAVVGAESTGTTTLARDLAERYDTAWVPEVGRAVSEERAAAGTFGDWTDADFVSIAARQQAEEDAAARRAGPVLFCDTDALATCVWQERYLGRSTPEVEALAASRRYDLYLLSGDDAPFVQDGLRDGEHLRAWMTARFAERLAERPVPHVLLSGSHAARLERASAEVDALLARGWSFG